MGTSVAVATNDEAWEKWKGVAGGTIPRDTIRSIAIGTVGLHVAEAAGAYASARHGQVGQPPSGPCRHFCGASRSAGAW